MEFYEVDTQLDSLSELKKTVSLKETSPIDSKSGHQKTVSSKENIDLDFPSGLQKTLSSTENNIKDTSDQSDHLLLSASSSSHMTSCSKTAAKSSMLPESSEQSSSDFEIVSDDGNKRKTWVNSYHYAEKCQIKTASKESEFLSIKVQFEIANIQLYANNSQLELSITLDIHTVHTTCTIVVVFHLFFYSFCRLICIWIISTHKG